MATWTYTHTYIYIYEETKKKHNKATIFQAWKFCMSHGRAREFNSWCWFSELFGCKMTQVTEMLSHLNQHKEFRNRITTDGDKRVGPSTTTKCFLFVLAL